MEKDDRVNGLCGVRTMNTLYQDILNICEEYLSGSSQKFLDRQIIAHLKKTPESIVPEDASEIAKWSQVSCGLLLGQSKAEHMAKDICTLVNGHSHSP